MIGRLSGLIAYKDSGQVLIDVRGVAYIVHVSDRTLAALPAVGEAASLWTDLLVREDLLQLYGFLTLQEKEWHRLLTTVQGVGAKAAMAILGTLGAEGLSRALALGDARAVRAAPGVGPKLAERVVLELKGKAPALMAMGGTAAAEAEAEAIKDPAPAAKAPPQRQAQPSTAAASAEALSALVNLGYQQGEAAAAVAAAVTDATAAEGQPGAAETPALIRAALKKLAPKG